MNGFEIPFDQLQELEPTRKLTADHSEHAVLSILANFPAAFDAVSDELKPEHFSYDDNRKIFLEIQRQVLANRGMDVVTVLQGLDGIVASDYVIKVLQSNDHGSQGLKKHMALLVDKYKSRQLHSVSAKLSELAYGDGPADERIDAAQAAVQALEVQGGEDEWVDAYTAAIEHLELLEARERGEVTGLATGIADLDELLDGGPSRGNLVVIGARPAMGKTALAMTIGLGMSHRMSVGFASLEMPHSDVRDRQTAILGHISIADIKRPRRGDGLDFSKVVDATERAKPLKWNVTAKSEMHIQQMRSMARRLKRSRGLDVLIVDYIGLMRGIPGKNYGASRVYEIQDITVGLKSLAKELDIAVIALAQVGRGADPKKPPTLRDLRDSGSIEQDADIVAFIHRPIQENPDLGAQFANYALLRVAKNRQGSTGDVNLFYRGEITGFEAWHGDAPRETSTNSNSRGFDD